MLLPYLIYNLSDRGDEFSAAEHGNASAYEMRSVQARSRMRLSHASLARDRSPLPTLSLSQNKTTNTNNTTTHWLPRARITSSSCPRRLSRTVETPSGLPDAAQLTRPTPSLVSVTFVGPAVISPVERATARSLSKSMKHSSFGGGLQRHNCRPRVPERRFISI